MRKRNSILLLGILFLSACQPAELPITLRINWGADPDTLDPALVEDEAGKNVIHNLFVGLTQYHPETNEVLPSLATTWEFSEDVQEVTFYLRRDIPWVRYDPENGEVQQVLDGEGAPRFVNAYDVEYAILRSLGLEGRSSKAAPLEIIAGIEVVNPSVIKFRLKEPAAYFPALMALWPAWPLPQWAVEEHGGEWTTPAHIITSGPYLLDTWTHGNQLILVKNPLWVGAESVQIERVEGVFELDYSKALHLFDSHDVEDTPMDVDTLFRRHHWIFDFELARQTEIINYPCIYYYGFNNQKYPFTDRNVRAAFSMAIDRQLLIDGVLKGGQFPATSFVPSNIPGGGELGQVGYGFDPDSAQKALQVFLDQEGLTLDEFNSIGITLLHNTSEGHARIAAAIGQMWLDNLGVEVKVEFKPWEEYLITLENTTPIERSPHIFRMGWCPDYPDENDWLHEVFNTEAGLNRLRRNCSDPDCGISVASQFDKLTFSAGKETHGEKRKDLYREAERIIIEEEVAFVPIFYYSQLYLTKPWLTRNYPTFGGYDIWNWHINVFEQIMGRGAEAD